jgi:hypothetical protein
VWRKENLYMFLEIKKVNMAILENMIVRKLRTQLPYDPVIPSLCRQQTLDSCIEFSAVLQMLGSSSRYATQLPLNT